ncbi:MAG: glycosyltransferase family 4 protein [Raoultibacter sp.]
MNETYCIFSANYLPNTGGVECYTQNLAYALAGMGKRAIIVTSNVFGLAEREHLAERIEIIRLPCRNVLKGRYPLPLKNESYKKEMAYLEAQPIDNVIINTRFYFHSLEGVRFAEKKGVKPILIDHGSAHLTMGNSIIDIPVSAYEHAFTAMMKRHAIDYYAVSSAGVAWLTHFGIEARGVLSNSIDAETFRNRSSERNFRAELGLDDTTFVVSFVGRLIPEKGIAALAEAASLLKGEPAIQFLLAGDGPLATLFADGKYSNVHLLGKLDATDISALLSTANAFCLPTRSEGFSTSLLEAAAWGTTPIITQVGGVAELMPTSDYGLLLESANAPEIVAHIRTLAANPALNQQLGSNIKNRVDTLFSWDATANNVIAACAQANGRI